MRLPDPEPILARLAEHPNVLGVGRGEAFEDGEPTGEPALIVTVERKRALRRLRHHERLPRRLEMPGGPPVRVDVLEVAGLGATGASSGSGDPVYSVRTRPLRQGYSFGPAGRTGTLGLVVTADEPDESPPVPLLLSSSHVVSLRPDGRAWPLFQPGGVDRDRSDPEVARSYRFTELSRKAPNRTEGGLAAPAGGCAVEAGHPLGPFRAAAPSVEPGTRLRKISRTTGAGSGTVAAVDWCGWVRFGRRKYPFEGQVLVVGDDGPVSVNGDSGAVWFTEDGRPAAMNFAGCRSGHGSVATPVGRLLRKLGVRLPTREEAGAWA